MSTFCDNACARHRSLRATSISMGGQCTATKSIEIALISWSEFNPFFFLFCNCRLNIFRLTGFFVILLLFIFFSTFSTGKGGSSFRFSFASWLLSPMIGFRFTARTLCELRVWCFPLLLAFLYLLFHISPGTRGFPDSGLHLLAGCWARCWLSIRRLDSLRADIVIFLAS